MSFVYGWVGEEARVESGCRPGVGLLASTDNGKTWAVRMGGWSRLNDGGHHLGEGVIEEKRDGELLMLAQATATGVLYQVRRWNCCQLCSFI